MSQGLFCAIERAHMRRLLIATTNRHKLEELEAILWDVPFQLCSLQDVGVEMDVEETGQTFAENATIKARAYAKATGLLCLADDSGLEIDALGGAPGVYSARFAGRETPYEERFRIILEKMQGLTGSQRSARFRCAIAVAEPTGFCRVVEGTIEGRIADRPRGEHGFGYDPIFLVPGLEKTTAELLPGQKNWISHRARAAQVARLLLQDWPPL
jgi:XTP/dITP diphosphohydrolase